MNCSVAQPVHSFLVIYCNGYHQESTSVLHIISFFSSRNTRITINTYCPLMIYVRKPVLNIKPKSSGVKYAVRLLLGEYLDITWILIFFIDFYYYSSEYFLFFIWNKTYTFTLLLFQYIFVIRYKINSKKGTMLAYEAILQTAYNFNKDIPMQQGCFYSESSSSETCSYFAIKVTISLTRLSHPQCLCKKTL